MKKAAAVILIVCLILSMGSVGLAADVGPGAVPADPGGDYPSYEDGYVKPEKDPESTVTIEIEVINGGILFTVTDSRCGLPIEGATVTERLSTQGAESAVLIPGTTDANGELLRELPTYADERTYVYIVSAVGYKASGEISVIYQSGSIVSIVGLTPEVMPVLFAVSNETGATVGGAEVKIAGVSRSARTAEEVYTCDGKGFARCELPDGIYSYTVTHPHHEDLTGTVAIDSTQKNDHTEIVQMQRKQFTVGFIVKDADGRAVRDAVVSMAGQGVRTDGNGQAQAIGLYAGEYSFFVTCEGYETHTGTLSVPAPDGICAVVLQKTPPPQPGPTGQPDDGGNHGDGSGGNGNNGNDTRPTLPPQATPTPEATSTALLIDNTPVNVVLLVKYTDGTPAAGLKLELHSRVQYGTTGTEGTKLFRDVEMGRHTVYVKNDTGRELAQTEFDLKRSDLTTLEIESGITGVTVRAAVQSIIIELEIDPDTDSGMVTAVREGYLDKTNNGKDNGGSTEGSGGIVVTGETDERQAPPGCTFFGTPFCLTEELFGETGPFCLLLGLACWAWYAILIAAAIAIVLVVLHRRKKRKKGGYDTRRPGRYLATEEYTIYDGEMNDGRSNLYK